MAELPTEQPTRREPQRRPMPQVPTGGPNTFVVPIAPKAMGPSRPVPMWAPQFSPMPPTPERR